MVATVAKFAWYFTSLGDFASNWLIRIRRLGNPLLPEYFRRDKIRNTDLLIHILLAALGGAIGTSGRYLVGIATIRAFGPGYPWGTITVNIIGSAVIGALVELLARRFGASADMRIFIVTGVLGGFTTFSSFALDAVNMMERGNLGAAALYIGASLVLSIAALFGGLALVRAFV